MNSFTYFSPTKVVFGENAEMSAANEIKNFGGSRVMLVYGSQSIIRSGLLDKIQRQLKDAGIPFTELGGVRANPYLSVARKGVEQAIKFGADFVLAVGGGSVIDTAKAIVLGTSDPDTDIWSFWAGEVVPDKCLPVGVVLTIPAAGSEASDSSVLTNEDIKSKRGLSTDLHRPRFALMNPAITLTLPRYQVMCGVVDILMHTFERYFTLSEGNETTDELAEALLRVVIRNGEVLLKPEKSNRAGINAVLCHTDPICTEEKDSGGYRDIYQAMSELMWTGSLSHNGLTGLGAVSDFATHQLGHEISVRFDAAHGASLSVVWGSWAKYCYMAKPERFARFAKKVWGLEGTDVGELALEGIERTDAYFESIGAPVGFKKLGVGILGEDAINDMADRCVRYGTRTVGSFRVLGREDVYRIFKMANF